MLQTILFPCAFSMAKENKLMATAIFKCALLLSIFHLYPISPSKGAGAILSLFPTLKIHFGESSERTHEVHLPASRQPSGDVAAARQGRGGVLTARESV